MSYRGHREKSSDENNTVRRYRADSDKQFSLDPVVGVGTPLKLVSSACYEKRQVCVYLQK